jgi:hypothetical protein
MNRAVSLKLVDTFDDTVWCRGSFLHLILGMWIATRMRDTCAESLAVLGQVSYCT